MSVQYNFVKFNSVYTEKKGLFNNPKYQITLTLLTDSLKGDALKISNTTGYDYQHFHLNYSNISNVEEYIFNNNPALRIDFETQINSRKWFDSYIFPFDSQYNINDIINSISDYKNNFENEQNKIQELENERIQKQLAKEAKEQERIATIQKFYSNVYAFHINENTPVYTVNSENNNCFVIYINSDKDINFLVIDAEIETEIHTIIKYNEIHYYEKAGDVHYATNINANYKGGQSFGGSFVGAKVSTGAVALGGLLLGNMGMAIGALSSYKPATYTPPTYTPSQLNISSEITKIDERSVILNYYSEQHKQYIDIELPQDIYNFLQTYLPEKKYAIVIEKEKQNAISNSSANQTTSSEDTSIQRLQKLKQLYEMELITESEYAERKKEILAEI